MHATCATAKKIFNIYLEEHLNEKSNDFRLTTVNVDISVQLNFPASKPRSHIREVYFSRIYHLILFVFL